MVLSSVELFSSFIGAIEIFHQRAVEQFGCDYIRADAM
jgi:hypothetical protein